mmetsp:Transcript_351/g.973  ORF Transcript_351/g.973 Transcript_351/m.973 type:complete len:493 (-) Transcript_351:100-1578(-)
MPRAHEQNGLAGSLKNLGERQDHDVHGYLVCDVNRVRSVAHERHDLVLRSSVAELVVNLDQGDGDGHAVHAREQELEVRWVQAQGSDLQSKQLCVLTAIDSRHRPRGDDEHAEQPDEPPLHLDQARHPVVPPAQYPREEHGHVDRKPVVPVLHPSRSHEEARNAEAQAVISTGHRRAGQEQNEGVGQTDFDGRHVLGNDGVDDRPVHQPQNEPDDVRVVGVLDLLGAKVRDPHLVQGPQQGRVEDERPTEPDDLVEDEAPEPLAVQAGRAEVRGDEQEQAHSKGLADRLQPTREIVEEPARVLVPHHAGHLRDPRDLRVVEFLENVVRHHTDDQRHLQVRQEHENLLLLPRLLGRVAGGRHRSGGSLRSILSVVLPLLHLSVPPAQALPAPDGPEALGKARLRHHHLGPLFRRRRLGGCSLLEPPREGLHGGPGHEAQPNRTQRNEIHPIEHGVDVVAVVRPLHRAAQLHRGVKPPPSFDKEQQRYASRKPI